MMTEATDLLWVISTRLGIVQGHMHRLLRSKPELLNDEALNCVVNRIDNILSLVEESATSHMMRVPVPHNNTASNTIDFSGKG